MRPSLHYYFFFFFFLLLQVQTKIERINTGKDEANQIVDRLTINELIENLDLKEKEIIVLRYFKEKTQSQVAKILGISQVQVSRIEKKILRNLFVVIMKTCCGLCAFVLFPTPKLPGYSG